MALQAEAAYRAPTWPERQDKMIHLDIEVDDLEAGVQHAVNCGARLAAHQPQTDVRVLFDPAGHPFCLYIR